MSKSSFADLGVSQTVVAALARGGVTDPFPVQSLVIGEVLAGHDVLVRSPTGSGKTLAFALPIVERIAAEAARPAALILAPTRELVVQIAEELYPIAHARALKTAPVYGGVGLSKQSQIAARAHIIVATPGRLEDLLARGAFDLDSIQVLVLDEADRMLDMGFRPAVDRIVRQCPSVRQTLFFSATLSGETGRVAKAYTHNAVRLEHTPDPAHSAASVEHRFIEVESASRVAALVAELRTERDLALVFVRTKRGADRLVKRLGDHGVASVAMHGNRSQSQRERALASFESAKVSTLVATDVAARGIDVDRISHVINFDPPEDRDAYVHRVGRTGRAGRSGIGITFHSAAERGKIAGLADELGIEHSVAPGVRSDAQGASRRKDSPRPGAPRRARNKPAREAPRAGASASAPTGGRTRSYGARRGR
jgi:ATP-dependent RNA helicase RhlE